MDENVENEPKTGEPSCGNCRFFVRHEYENLDVITDYGQCRRYPPRRLSETESGFPLVIDDCLCGEWEQM